MRRWRGHFFLTAAAKRAQAFPPTLFRRRITCYPRPTSRDGGGLLTAVHAARLLRVPTDESSPKYTAGR